MNSISVNAYAKINLGLDVLRRREDGYHDVCMIMQSLELHDTITIEKTLSGGIILKNNLSYLPSDKDNLVYKAAALFLNTISSKDGLSIRLRKEIPVAAGLAGGSSDAAAALTALNRLYSAGLSTKELMKLGVTLGADVPYCIMLGTALSEGIGEVLTPLASMPECYILLVKPGISVSTKYVYENLHLSEASIHPDIPGIKAALEQGALKPLAEKMDNILQTVTERDYPVITDIKRKMTGLGALSSLMSGSGPTVFGIYRDFTSAKKAYHYFKKKPQFGRQVFLTKPYQPMQLL